MSKPRAKITSPSKAISPPTELENEEQFIAARELLSKLIGLPAIQKTFDPDAPPNSRIERSRVNTLDKLTRDVQKPPSSKKHSAKKPTQTAHPLLL